MTPTADPALGPNQVTPGLPSSKAPVMFWQTLRPTAGETFRTPSGAWRVAGVVGPADGGWLYLAEGA